MRYDVTVRYGSGRQSYHTFQLSADGIADALRDAADALPEEVSRLGDLVEVRPAVDPEGRRYLGEEGDEPEGNP